MAWRKIADDAPDFVSRSLTPRQRRFVEQYVYGDRAYEAKPCADLAGYSAKDVAAGSRLIRLPQIQEEIRRLILTRRVKWNFEQNDVENVHATIAFDPREHDKGGPTRRERMEAAMNLARMRGWLLERSQVDVGPNLADLLARAGKIEEALPPATPPERLKLVANNDAT
jgi:hypothetical protein